MTDSPNRWESSQHRASGEEYAKRFQKLAESGMDMHGEATLCDVLVGAPSRILDAGCGTGRVAVRLAELGHTCVGVDADESMLGQARLVAPEIEWVHADLVDVTLSTAGNAQPYDLVVAAGNVIPLLAEGSEQRVIAAMAGVIASRRSIRRRVRTGRCASADRRRTSRLSVVRRMVCGRRSDAERAVGDVGSQAVRRRGIRRQRPPPAIPLISQSC